MQFMYPAGVMVFYILIIGLANFRTRLRCVMKEKVSPGYFKVLDSQAYKVPEHVIRMGRHYDNQFELPMLFLITCVACTLFSLTNQLCIFAAWGFVLSRAFHTFFHLGDNNIIKRAAAFFAGWVFVAMMWILLLIDARNSTGVQMHINF
jgi:hypothetical protein